MLWLSRADLLLSSSTCLCRYLSGFSMIVWHDKLMRDLRVPGTKQREQSRRHCLVTSQAMYCCLQERHGTRFLEVDCLTM